MASELVIIGAGDFGREVSWVVERINRVEPTWNLLGFVDDRPEIQGKCVDGYPVLGPAAWLRERERETWVVCSIGTGVTRRRVMERVLANGNLRPATLIDPAAIVGRNVRVGAGCVVCAETVLAISAELHDHVIVNLNCTIGHDAVLEDYCTVHPGSNVSGKVRVGRCVDIGTGTKIIQGKTVAGNVILGAGAVVNRDIEEAGTYVGVPARRVH